MRFKCTRSCAVTVCSLAGYQQFLKRQWLQKILSWQNADEELGCFIDFFGKPEVEAQSGGGIAESSRVNSKVTKTAFSLRRRKRADEVLKFGETQCSVHFTAVSLSALAMHLRYFADTCLRRN